MEDKHRTKKELFTQQGIRLGVLCWLTWRYHHGVSEFFSECDIREIKRKQKKLKYADKTTVSSLYEGRLWDWFYVTILERCPSSSESTRRSKARQGPTLGVRFREVSVL